MAESSELNVSLHENNVEVDDNKLKKHQMEENSDTTCNSESLPDGLKGRSGNDEEQVFSNHQGDGDKLSLGSLKKDDSGIDFEKSPSSSSTKDCSLVSDFEFTDSIVSESFNDSAHHSSTNSLSDTKIDDPLDEVNDITGNSSGKTDNSSCGAYNLPSTPTQGERDGEPNSMVIDPPDDESMPCVGMEDIPSDTACKSEDNQMTDFQKKGEGTKLSEEPDTESMHDPEPASSKHDDLSSEDSDDNDSDIDMDVKSDKSSDSDSEYDGEGTECPVDTFHQVKSLTEREYGQKKRSAYSYFRQIVQGSLQMVERFELQSRLQCHEGCVNALHFNRIGTLLASGSDDLNIVLWNWIRSRPAMVYESGHRSNVFQTKFMPFSGDCHVVSCARDGQVRLADLSLTGRCKGTKKLAQHKGPAHKLALELDSPHILLSCGEDAVVYEVDLREEKPHKLATTKENDRKIPLYSIHSNPMNSYEFCVGGRDHYIRIYDKRKISENEDTGIVKKYCPHHLVDSDVKANVTCCGYSYNGAEVLGTYNDEDIYLFSNYDSDGANYRHKYCGHRNNATVKGVNFYGPNSEFIVSGSDCGHVFIWDKATERIVQFVEADVGGVINVLEPHPMAPVLATSGLDNDVKIWAPTARERTKLKGLKKTIKRNKRDRDNEPVPQDQELVDSEMLWFLMHHFRRRARRRAREEGESVSSSSSDNSDSEEEDPGGMQERLQCNPQ